MPARPVRKSEIEQKIRVKRVKRRIEQLLNGKFEYTTPRLVLLPEELTVEIEPGRTARGSFLMESEDGARIRGFLYSSNPRVVCTPTEFQGSSIEIHYQVDGSGFPEGEEERGCFTICSELGEYTLPFTLQSLQKEHRVPEELPVAHASELAALAQESFQSAYRCFLSEGYAALLDEEEPELRALYDALSFPAFRYQTMEEFLSGAGWKEPIQICVETETLQLGELTEPIAEKLRITKNTWGFLQIAVESDAHFLRPEKTVVTTDEFLGSSFELNLILDTNRMHRGKNCGRVTLTTPYQTLCVEVTAARGGRSSAACQKYTCQQMQKELESLYVRFRLHKIDLAAWTEHSIAVIQQYHRAGGSDPFADLFLVQLYYAQGRTQKAVRLLESLEEHRERLNTPDRYGFYLYMTTFFYQESSYVDQVEEEIRALLSRDRTNWKLQWILLYLQESLLQDENAKYEAVAEQFRYGCRSRIMYLEAYQILQENPFLMRHISSFELQLLRFARKEQVLAEDVVRQAANQALHYGKYSTQLLEILTDGYAQYPSEDLVKAICVLLMKGERRDRDAFVWYARGVEYGLRITGLYEYYMESTDNLNLQEMPQIIRMYFAYDTTLDYRKRAAVYRGIVENKEKDAQLYRTYRAAMEKFTVDQLEMGRMTEDLAVLYRTFLRRGMLSRSALEQLSRLLFTYELTCDLPQICSVTAHSAKLVREQSAVFENGRAQLAIYDPDSVLVLEDGAGNRFAAGQLCRKRKLFDSDEMLSWCTELVPDFPGILLFVCAACRKEGILNRNALPYLRRGCEFEEFSEEFRDTLRAMVLRYYSEHPLDESLREFLAQIDYLDYVKVDKTALIMLLAEEGLCSEAFSLLDRYGAEGILLLQLVRICSRMVLDLEFAENAMLVSLCHFCFESGKYDDKLLRYLLLYYEGPIREMKRVWTAARSFDLDTMLIEEKILTMILFTRSGTEGSEPVFEAYARKMGRRKLCRAYLNLKAYEYFVRGLPVADCVFRYIEREYVQLYSRGREEEQEIVCRLALLQHYANLPKLQEEQRTYAAQLLEEFSAKGLRFAFWKKLDPELVRPYQMAGRVFVEYVTDPKNTVTIAYRRRGSREEYAKETVKNCFEGIFVKEFTLFSGDELECCLEVESRGQTRTTDQRVLSADPECDGDTSRYGLLNRISRAQQEDDEETFTKELDNYLLLEYLAKELFPLA